MIDATALDRHVEKLFDVMQRVHAALTKAGIEYRIVGGMAVYLHVSEQGHDAGRFTKDVDIAVNRRDIQRISEAAEGFGFRYRHVAGVDMLVDAREPKARSAVHLVFTLEKVRPDYLEPVPDFAGPVVAKQGLLIAPVTDLVRMKLTSLRLKDKVHIIDMDGVGLITPEIETSLSEPLRRRLQLVREEERQSTGAE
jgi:hypothetical protein